MVFFKIELQSNLSLADAAIVARLTLSVLNSFSFVFAANAKSCVHATAN